MLDEISEAGKRARSERPRWWRFRLWLSDMIRPPETIYVSLFNNDEIVFPPMPTDVTITSAAIFDKPEGGERIAEIDLRDTP